MSLPVDAEAIRALARILNETGLTEIEIAEKDSRIRVVRAHPPAVTAHLAAPPAEFAPGGSELEAVAPLEPEDFSRHAGAVKSPMVGVAYLSPEPGAAAFVLPGQQVAAGQTLLLIEAMKTFNQIKAPKAGTLRHILITTGSPVEYGEVLMVIDG